MKKIFKRFISVIVATTLLISSFGINVVYANASEFRGAWISTVFSADFPSVQNDIEGQKKEFTEKLDKLKALGMNAVIVQVRPKGDAFYKSELNPWSGVLTGEQGKDPGYDPMAFMIEEAHKRGMEFHAWLNPYRITTSGTDLTKLSEDNMARKNPDWVLSYNNALYYNPEMEEVKQYVVDTVSEIVKNYDVEGIHFDDYFYPSNYPLEVGTDREGEEANERRNHVNEMVEQVSNAIESINPKVQFGISPMGIWKNDTSDPLGSDTNGSEGYYTVFADAKTWIEEGLIDYIVPQIYWEIGNAYADYETVLSWWSELVEGSEVDLYIGQGIYKDAVAGEITKQLDINKKYNTQGSIFFSARDLLDNRSDCGTAIKKYYTSPNDSESSNKVPPTVIEKKIAYATNSSIKVDGALAEFEVYTIDDYSYFKLRDLAHAINGTQKQFDTSWNEKEEEIHITSGSEYTGTSSTGGAVAQKTTAITSTAKLRLDEELKSVRAFTINDYTYYKLRDIGKLLDIGITWDESTMNIGIDTSSSY